MEKEIELNEEDLDQVFGAIPFEEAKDKALNAKNIHRIKQIEELKLAKEQLNQYINSQNIKSGRNR